MDLPEGKSRRFYLRYHNWLQVNKRFSIVLLLIALLLLGPFILLSPPADFPAQKVIKIPKGSGLSEIAGILADNHVIRSRYAFIFLAKVIAGSDGLKAGRYYLDRRLPGSIVVRRLARGEFDPSPFKVTIPEGLSNLEIYQLINRTLPIDRDKFLRFAQAYEGELYPDTYFFIHKITEEEIIEQMTDNFSSHTLALQKEAASTGKQFDQILVMASILEEEARTPLTRRMVSGILWQRIQKGMPLQVDAVFPYLIGKGTYDLTKKDLRYDSPYNTYRYKGLPPGPIDNPSLDAIEAALHPSSTSYLYYLSDKDGNMHYAQTYKEHMRNVAAYLK